MSTTNSAGWDAGTSMHPAIGEEPEHDPFTLDDEIAHLERGGDVSGWTPAYREDGGPAFPKVGRVNDLGRTVGAHDGMTLRDYFAAKALPAVINTPGSWRDLGFKPVDGRSLSENTALCAYQLADAMLKARQA